MLWPNPQKLYNIQTKSFEVHENKHKDLIQDKVSPRALKQINETIKLKKVENEYIEALKKKKKAQESFRLYKKSCKNRKFDEVSETEIGEYGEMLFGIREDIKIEEENDKESVFGIENEKADMENDVGSCIEEEVAEVVEEKNDKKSEDVDYSKDLKNPCVSQDLTVNRKSVKIKTPRLGIQKEFDFSPEGKNGLKFPPICITNDSKQFVYIVGNMPPIFSSNYDKKHIRSLSPVLGKNELIDYSAKAHPAYYCYRDLDKKGKKNNEAVKRRNKSTCKNCHSKINVHTSMNLLMEVEARKLKSLHNLQNFKFKKLFPQY